MPQLAKCCARVTQRFSLAVSAAALLVAGIVPVKPAAADDMTRVLASVCEYTKANDRSNLRKRLDSAGIDLRHTYDGIACNNMSLLRTAAVEGAVDTATFIATKVGKNAINKPEADGKTVLEWAEGQVASNPKIQPVLELLKSKA